MKLHEILTEDYTDRYKPFSEDQYQMAYDAIEAENSIMDMSEIKEMAKGFAETERFGREFGSALFLLTRMHILTKGYAPYGITERSAEQMFMPSRKMEKFVENLGYNVASNISKARQNLATRPQGRRKRPDALKVMADFYKKNKASLPKDIVKHRDEIVDRLMRGLSPQDAFTF